MRGSRGVPRRHQTVDLLIVLYFIGFFVLGFAQGTIRRLIGIGSILFSWFLAANLAEPLGDFLGKNWTQFPRQYSYMVGFLHDVRRRCASRSRSIAQGFYKPQPLFQKARFADEIIGGLLGVIEAAIILGARASSSSTRSSRSRACPTTRNELPFLREIWTALDATPDRRRLPRHADPGVLRR